MIVIHVVYGLVAAYLLLITLHQTLLTVAAYFFRKPTITSEEEIRFAVVIGSSPRTVSIARTLASLRQSRYPRERYAIFVTPELGSQVRQDESVRVLADGESVWDGFDAIVWVRGDSLLHPNFLREAALNLADARFDGVQGYEEVQDPRRGMREASHAALRAIFFHLRSAGRAALGLSCLATGNGTVLRRSVFERHGLPLRPEQLLVDGVRLAYNPDSMVKVPGENGFPRGRRWRKLMRYGWIVLRRAVTSWRYLDALLELITPPLTVLVSGLAIWWWLSLVWYAPLISTFAGALLCTLIYILSGPLLQRATGYVWACLVTAPFFALRR